MRFVTAIPVILTAGLLGSTGCASAEGNRYNPYLQSRLPALGLNGESEEIARALGGKASSLQDEAAHRKNWKEEVYPVVFGNRKASNEVLVFLDYANPESRRVWAEVVAASRKLDPKNSKIVVMGKSSEPYGTELMGGEI